VLVTARTSLPLSVAVWAAAAWASPARVLAHPLVDEGQRLYEEAEFVAALDALGRADHATDLEREDLERLFEIRALVHLAMGNTDAMRTDLQRLAALAPDHSLPRSAPPDVARAFAEIRGQSPGAVRVLATTEASPAGVTIAARAENDWASIVRTVRVSGRVQGAPSWEHATDAPLLVATSGGVVEYYAEAIGPGGVVVARTGSASEPLRAAGAGGGGGGGEAWPWVLVALGVAVVAGGVVVGVVLGTESGTPVTQVEPFTVRF
jgi:hypothetical protein